MYPTAEHARNISRSSNHNAVLSETLCPAPVPAFHQLPSKPNVPNPAPVLRTTPQDSLLDYSLVGMSGANIFHEMMRRHNVKHMFGIPGGAILPVFDAIHDSNQLDFVLSRHEQGAGHMAEGYARASGKPGVVLVTSGPGVTNVVTPMQDALSDGVPMVVFCGQVPTSSIGKDAFQEVDIISISRSCTKWNVMVKQITELPRRINEAFKIATSGRPGPVLVDLPKDVTASILRSPLPFEATTPELSFNLKLPSNPLHTPDYPQSQLGLIRQAAQLINKAKRPLIYAGHGVLGDPLGPKLVTQLAREGNIPVTTTLLGLGAFDETDPRSLHMVGMHGSAYANFAMQQADVIIALGARFDDRVTGNVSQFAPAVRAAAAQGRGGFIHFEIQPKNVNKIVDADIPIIGDVTENLREILPLIKYSERASWFKDINEWKEKYPFVYMKPQEVIEELDRQVAPYKENVIVTTGVGQHQMWAAQHFRWRYPRSMISSGGLGHEVRIVTRAHRRSLIGMLADLFYDRRYSNSRLVNPDFVLLAKAMGAHAIRVSSARELPEKMKEFLEYDGNKPVLLECAVEVHEHVFPMVPAGGALDKQILHPTLRDNK
ncbi:acetolactate synthase [Russula dissimulans]|nr:acetolactate synthase [Russula dissimulans]